MTSPAKPIPTGFHTITPKVVVRDADHAIDFYQRAFGAKERMRVPGPDGKIILHAELMIGDSIFMLTEEKPQMGCLGPQSLGGTPVELSLYIEDVDKAFNRAVSAGATVRLPLADWFWGDRAGKVADPFGHEWMLATQSRGCVARGNPETGHGLLRPDGQASRLIGTGRHAEADIASWKRFCPHGGPLCQQYAGLPSRLQRTLSSLLRAL